MKICFIANFTKTYFFHEVAQKLQKEGIDIYWIVVNHKNAVFLRQHYPESHILYLAKSKVIESEHKPVGEYKINELIWGDRVLKHHYSMAFSFLTHMQEMVYNFIKNNGIRFLFGELTWAHEVLIFRIVKDHAYLNCKYLNPHTVRIPSGRFAFFEDEFQTSIYITDEGYRDKNYLPDAFLPKKPDYLALNDVIVKRKSSLRGKWKRLNNFITGTNMDKEDITLPVNGSLSRIIEPIKEEVNREAYKMLKKVDVSFVVDKHFILLTLHKQPEASIDVLGRYGEDQYVNIVNIWRQLPAGWWLVVKEHSNAVGDRPRSFYTKLQKLHNLVFINEQADSYVLLKMAEAVCTVSGTIAYEAALMNKKAIVMSKVFFELSGVKLLTNEGLKHNDNLMNFLNEETSEDDEVVKRKIYFNSFPGIISDPLNNPACIASENIMTVAQAFLKLKE